MATQASAITFMSTPGQGYESGLGFVQNYFGMPLALIIVAAVFLPLYRRLDVYTAYEFLGRRFDAKTRLLGAALFLLMRGPRRRHYHLRAGDCALDRFRLAPGCHHRAEWLLVIVYTVTGGSRAVTLTQKYQLALIFGGMVLAFIVLLARLPAGLTLTDAFTVAGGFRKLEAVNFSFDVHQRYTFWSGLLGGLFLSLSYFGTDQSQVQRYSTALRCVRAGWV